MKKELVIALSIAVAAAAVGCGGSAGSSTTAAQTTAAQTAAASAETITVSAETTAAASDTKAEAAKAEETKAEETKAEETKAEEAKTDETKAGQDAETAAADETKDAAASLPESKPYESKDGWKVRYNPEQFTVTEKNDAEHLVQFVWSGECAGTDMVAFSYVPDKQPQEVLAVATEGWDQEKVIRTEGHFAGRDDVWCFRRDLMPEGNGGESPVVYQSCIAAEHNGGVILVEFLQHMEKEDGANTQISDALSELFNSFEFTNHAPQEMYSYVPGTYKIDEAGKPADMTDVPETVTMKEDHTTVFSNDPGMGLHWGSIEITEEKYQGKTWEYTMEGETLLLNIGDNWISYNKQ